MSSEPPVTVRFHPHARERMAERGADEGEVAATLSGGEPSRRASGEPAFVGTSPTSPYGVGGTMEQSRLRPTRSKRRELGW